MNWGTMADAMVCIGEWAVVAWVVALVAVAVGAIGSGRLGLASLATLVAVFVSIGCVDEAVVVDPCTRSLDVTQDGVIDRDDVDAMAQVIGYGLQSQTFDVDCNGRVDRADLAFVTAGWQQAVAP